MRILRVAAILAAAVLPAVLGAPPVAAQTACADMNGTVGPDGVCTVHTSNATYTLDMTFPNDYPDQQALTAYLTQARDGFVNVSEMPGSYNLPYELDAKGTGYRSGSPTAGTQSVVFTMWQNVGGVHPQTWYKSFNWDLGKKAPLTFDTLFKPDAKPLNVIYPAVEQYLQKQQGLIDGIPASVGLDPAKYQNFALTDDALLFFFGQGELFAESAGPVEASVPRATVESLLA
ncbi:hypothetical protein A5724_16640 [Mycobacterium sp. ACS1612]|uniref:esterase n=1 Tax=Mycobacterium sp. ACS1612 TaxID=1834117 RepID=UPI0007FD9DBE|nr:esterase [Mycobacterium sp. ACS1612]OBF34186.1 hypothetical protein A5724_16640 [Mycobacterium sp. ACS1612]